jgi:hypothetical protein
MVSLHRDKVVPVIFNALPMHAWMAMSWNRKLIKSISMVRGLVLNGLTFHQATNRFSGYW